MAAKTIFAIDIGSANLKGIVALFDPKKDILEIKAKVEVPSVGLKKGVIVDVDDAARALGTLVDQVEARVERELKEALVTIDGPHLETKFAKGAVVVSRADEEIGKEDVERVLQVVEASQPLQNRVLLHVIPQSYLIDEADRVKDPIGMQGTRLSVEALLVDTFAPSVKNVEKCFHALGITPMLTVASILAGSRAAVPQKERDLGSCAIDIGAETTSLAVFEDGELVHAAVIPLGSRNVTGDLATALKIQFDAAERVKREAGHALASRVSKKDMISLAEFVEGEEEQISRRYIADVIEARLSEIFELIAEELKKNNRAGKLPGGAILFGGGSKIPEIELLAKHELKLASRVATLDHYRKMFADGLEIEFYPACGLLLWALDSFYGRGKESQGSLGVFKKVFRAFLP